MTGTGTEAEASGRLEHAGRGMLLSCPQVVEFTDELSRQDNDKIHKRLLL